MSTDAPITPEAEPATPRPPRKKWPWIVGAAAAIILAAAIAIPVSIGAAERAAAQEAAARAAAAEEARLDTFRASITRCGENPGRGDNNVKILDDGETIELLRVTKYDGITYDALECFLRQLGAPDAIEAAIGQTRALDGRQSDSWDGFDISWSYHPDSGASIVIEHAD